MLRGGQDIFLYIFAASVITYLSSLTCTPSRIETPIISVPVTLSTEHGFHLP